MAFERTLLVAGNWKMNMLTGSGRELAAGVIRTLPSGGRTEVLLCPPFTALAAVHQVLNDLRPRRLMPDGSPQVRLGAQDIYPGDFGAFTGEISAPMLRDVGCTYVLAGHSERRHVLGESDDVVARKVEAARQGGLTPILCVGEREEERDQGRHQEVVDRQLTSALAAVGRERAAARVVVAYEPVWAIGTGKTASPADAQQMHAYLRRRLGELFGEATADRIRILYGGSVKPGNAADLLAQPDIDGALVGGASLDPDSFGAIVGAAEEVAAPHRR